MQALILKILTFLFTMPFLAGYRTYIVAAGLLGKAIYDVSVGEFPQAVTDFLGFLAAVGVRAALATGQVSAKAPLVALALPLAASGGFAAEPKTYADAVKIATEKHQPIVVVNDYTSHEVWRSTIHDAVLYFAHYSTDPFEQGMWLVIPKTKQMYPLPPGAAEAQKAVDYVNCHEPNPQPIAVRGGAPSCTGQGCDCGVYGGSGNGCGCAANMPAINCPRPRSQYQLQPLPLRTGLIYPGCANGSCPGGR